MRRAIVLASAIVIAGCPLMKKKAPEDAGPALADLDAAAADAAPAAPADPTADATNKTKVARYGDETKIAAEPATLLQGVAARSFPPNGDFIASLKAGTSVTKVALHEDYVLVAFENPKNAGERLIGWVSPNGFKTPPAAGTPTKAQCKADKDCKGGGKCVLTGPARNVAQCAVACAAQPPVCPTGQECAGEGTYDNAFFAFCTPVHPKGDATTTYKVGDHVQVEWHGSWYPAKIIALPAPNRYRVHYDGYDASWDENVDPTRIKK